MQSSQVDAPQGIAPSDKERQAGVYSPRNLQKVLGGLHRDGLVVLKGVIDVDHIDALNEAMCADAERWIADPEQEFNHDVKCEIRSVLNTGDTCLAVYILSEVNTVVFL